MSRYVQNGVEMAVVDVPGTNLDPTAVHKARGVEMDYVKGSESTTVYPGQSSRRPRVR